MHWSLMALAVAAGIGLVLAKKWFDRREANQEREIVDRRYAAGSAAAHRAHPHGQESPQVSVAAADEQVATAAASGGVPGAETEPPHEDRVITEAAVSQAGDAEPDDAEPDTEASSEGTSDARRVEEALGAGDLSVMETALQEVGDPIHRNLLLSRLVAGHYRLRSEPGHREAFYRVAHEQIEEASAILNAIEATGRQRPDQIDAFKSVAIALDEDERYDEAIALCKEALSLGLEDGTKTGFEGRIARLEKSRASGRGRVGG